MSMVPFSLSDLSLRQCFQLLATAGRSWSENKTARLGAALAFYSVLSLAPLLLLVLTAATALWGGKAAQGEIMGQMTALVGSQGAAAIQNILASADHNQGAGFLTTIIGLITLLFSASGVFGELHDAMNTIWHVKPPRGQALWVMLRERFFSFTMVVGSGFLMLVSLVITAGLSAASHFMNGLMPNFLILMNVVNFIVSFGVIAFLFTLIFKVIPNANPPWRSVWPGGVLTAALFLFGKMLISVYLGHAAVASTYGAAGSFVALLVWVYYSAQILFFGAEFTYVYSMYLKRPKKS